MIGRIIKYNLLFFFCKLIMFIMVNSEGLLTVRALSDGAEFGITTRPSPTLDTFHVVFGRVIDGIEVLSAIEKIQTYSYKTTTGSQHSFQFFLQLK